MTERAELPTWSFDARNALTSYGAGGGLLPVFSVSLVIVVLLVPSGVVIFFSDFTSVLSAQPVRVNGSNIVEHKKQAIKRFIGNPHQVEMGNSTRGKAVPMPTRLRSFVDDRIHVEQGDITGYAVDAIVNAANSQLSGGGGVDGAIHRAGGSAIAQACRELRRTRYPRGLPTGEVAATPGGNLPAQHVIHTAGPIYGQEEGREAELLAACYHNSLQWAADNGWSSIAFPAISTGIYGYPREEAAEIASTAIFDFLNRDTRAITVYLVFFLADDAAVFLAHHKFPR